MEKNALFAENLHQWEENITSLFPDIILLLKKENIPIFNGLKFPLEQPKKIQRICRKESFGLRKMH